MQQVKVLLGQKGGLESRVNLHGLSPLDKFALLDMIKEVELVSMMLRADTEESCSLLSGSCSKAMVFAQPSHSRECWSLHSLHIQKKNTRQGPKGS